MLTTNHLKRKIYKKATSLSKGRMFVFALVFGLIGGYSLYLSFASPNVNLAGDLDGNNVVNSLDLEKLKIYYGLSTPEAIAAADINGDGVVNIIDLSIMASHWGTANNCSPQVNPTENLTNPGFEGNYTKIAPGWANQVYGNPIANFSNDTTTPHSGSTAQKITIAPAPNSRSGAFFLQNYTFKGGETYEGSVWMKSTDNATVDFLIRRNGPYYEAGAIQRVKLTSTWKRYTIRGGWDSDVPGFFGISFASAGTVYMDDASLRVVAGETDCLATQQAIPADYFGMHINKWGNYSVWPTLLNFKMLRLWDTGTRWMHIEPTKGNWNWTRFDYYVKTAQTNNEDIIYTLGMTPAWASLDSTNTAPPSDINDWRTYVRTVATRYKGKIKYWEIWNEIDYNGFYTGNVDQMYQLTIAANQELKAVDPTNVILSPNITTHGLKWLDQFLLLGGSQYVDIISWHRYSTYTPELDLPLINSVKSIMNQHGVNKPIWNTEGATVGSSASTNQIAGSIARNYIMFWSWGVTNFNWYGWDNGPGEPLSQPDYITPTTSGIAYQQISLWLSGSKMLSKHRADNGTWIVSILENNGKNAYILWNDTQATTFVIPPAWSAQTKKDLSRASSSMSGISSVPIGFSPILIEP